MIQLDNLILKNYKCHRNLELDFGSGVTAIVGDNGSGKSSVISAIRFLFTGEVDTKSKQESITLGETEGWVRGTLTLNDKEAVLERHLATSKVVLQYDGTKYNKATEVKDLWAKLLQIDTSLFNNVIIAAQGDIPLLFSGDSTVREKVFQKIFLVPPTERLRSIIWDQYIKTCPPEKFEENVSQLQSEEARVATVRNNILQEIDQKTSAILNDAFLKCIMERIAFLEKCQRDSIEKPRLELEARGLDISKQTQEMWYNTAQKGLEGLDIDELTAAYNHLLSQKKLAEHTQLLEDELFRVEAQSPTYEQLEESRGKVAEVDAEVKEVYNKLVTANAEIQRLKELGTTYQDLQGHVACPTCGQEIKDIVEAMAHHVEQEAEARKMAVACNAKYTVANKRLQRLTADLSLMEGQYQRVSNLKQQLSRYDDITYSQEELDILSKAIDTYKSGTKVSNAAELELQKITGQLALNAEKQKGLAVYDGDASIEEELTTMREVIEENKKRIAALESLRVEEAKLRHELELLEQRIETSLENHKHNEKRRLYIEKMQKAYDILHVSKFPRKLIESYSEHVQAHLTKYLDKFNIPYRAKIAEGFRIQMLNTENQEMPMVSGGQEMIVGICLRLALHKMFAQSFPMWIVDEGTTHLSESNRKAYFRLIEDIRTNKIVNQVLIIDHDPQLSTVVDRTIQL